MSSRCSSLLLVTALATGLGALPLIFVRSARRLVLGASNAVAAGVMLAASVSLCREGVDRVFWGTAVGLALGICFVLVTERHLGFPGSALQQLHRPFGRAPSVTRRARGGHVALGDHPDQPSLLADGQAADLAP